MSTPFSKVLDECAANAHQTLDARQARWQDDDGSLLVDACKQHKLDHITSVNLSGCRLGSKGATALAGALPFLR